LNFSYILDANVFIQAHREGYPLDVFPSYWQKMIRLAEEGKIISIDKVKNEIYQNEDDLKFWCESNLPDNFFKPFDGWIKYQDLMRWANGKLNNPYSRPALDTFMDAEDADAFIIAYAATHNMVVVTREISTPMSKSSIKLPDAAQPFGVRTLMPNVMLRELGVKI
jgi:hypothetical protein